MLVVETYLGPSEIHGTGVFAATPLAKGTLVWIFNSMVDQKISFDQLRSVPARVREMLVSRSFVHTDGRIILSRDNGVFLNHSEAPNLSGGLGGSTAVRDIEAHEELTEDYRLLPPGACRAFLDVPTERRSLIKAGVRT